MATVSVSNASGLRNALASAERGDVLLLAGGNYGSLGLNGNSRVADYTFDGLTIKSTTDEGYEHGFGVKLFSHGGDSGAGMFLVENGHATHKLVGVCRQPDPDTNTDELTRVDRDFLAWFKDNAAE